MIVAQTIRPEPLARHVAIAMAHSIGQSGVLKLLSSMYLCKPWRETITGWTSLLRDDDGGLDDLKGALNRIDTASDGILQDLLWDYTRLFIGPYKLPCPPWESVYRSQARLMMQDAADDVRRTYAVFGLSVEETRVMPDHIGIELNFLSLVYERAGEKSETQFDSTRIGEAFLNDHLLQWVPQFTADMEAAAESHLYKALARTTRKTFDLLSA
jgi:TorA maturation chaperone TorD